MQYNLQNSLLTSLKICGKSNFKQPADWSDIRKDCPENSIALYAAHREDYSDYNNLGFTATCTGGYKVFIDGTLYNTYNSEEQCNITWSTSGITTGDSITTPSALKAHVIWITPANEGAEITAFKVARVAESGTEYQCILWAHFNLSNEISLENAFYGESSSAVNDKLMSVTSKNNKINVSSIGFAFCYCYKLEYLPKLTGNNTNYSIQQTFYSCNKLPQVSLSNMNINYASNAFTGCYVLEDIKASNVTVNISQTWGMVQMYTDCNKLKKILPATYGSGLQDMSDYITCSTQLQDTVIDVRTATALYKIGTYGNSSYFMSGLKGLRVSNQAPFNDATSPQIDVSYTGMNRTALVTLFNDLPTVSDGQIIDITGCTGTADLSENDKDIATNKGWTIDE